MKWNFRWNWREVVAYQISAHCFAQSCNHSWVSKSKYGIRSRPHVPNWILCKAADLSRQSVRLAKERASAQIQIQQHSYFRWLRAKAWKRCQVWFWIDSNQSLHPDRSQMKCNLSEERASAQIQIEQHSDLRWRRANAWKWCLAWFWIHCNQRLRSNRSQMKCVVWKPCSDQHWQVELQFLDLKIFQAICLCKHSSTVLLINHP